MLRDRWGVAHIYAVTSTICFSPRVSSRPRTACFKWNCGSARGKAASRRFWSSSPARDINARLLSYRGDMKSEYESYSPDTKEILESFTAGINAYMQAGWRQGGKVFQWNFNCGFSTGALEADRLPEPHGCLLYDRQCIRRTGARAGAQAVGNEAASRLFDFDPPVTLDPAPSVDLAGLSPSLLRNLVGSDTRIEFSKALQESNNWTVSGKLTRTGKPLLANDPHRVIAEPSLRYTVHLVAPGWDVIGAGEPGLPGVALGHNQNIAWGFTIFGLDQQDLYLEELNPADASQYKTAQGWQTLETRKEAFGIRGGPNVQVDLKFTQHGPVLWADGKRALALHWVGAEPGTAGYLGSLAVDRAQNWQEFEAAMPRWRVPSENIVYADREGNIGEHSVGLAPLRKNWTGLLPVPGAGGYEWSGFVPTTELPHQFNPASGFVATANHKMIPDNYPYKVGYSWAPPYRFQRISQVLQQARSGDKLDVEALGRLQSDVLSLPALQFVDLLRARGRSTEIHSSRRSSAGVEWRGPA